MKRFVPCVFLCLVCLTGPALADVPVYGYRVVHSWPHDTGAYTEGLFWHDGYLYESTGNVGTSTIRKVDLKTGETVKKITLMPPYYGEGIIVFGDKLYQLTWQSGTGFIYDFDSFRKIGQFSYPGQGWALTTDGKHIYMSDGTPQIRVLDPDSLAIDHRITVTWNGHEVANVNELEWIKGEIWANIWLTRRIARINPKTGAITGFVDLTGLGPKPGEMRDPNNDVLNGIAYDSKRDRIFVTGKNWPQLYQIELTRPRKP
ncbi:MAG: glutaminyl-peptide cyclotransferase [Rhodanobacteraceae bacterium]